MPRFLCDAMLGSLGRWLRFLGYDCLVATPAEDDAEVLEAARREGRWLLTRDHELASWGPRTCLIAATGLDDQLVEVLSRHGLKPRPTLEASRCAVCNGELCEVDPAEVAAEVPPYVARTAVRFRRCAGCGRVYWPGSHGERIRRRLERVCERMG